MLTSSFVGNSCSSIRLISIQRRCRSNPLDFQCWSRSCYPWDFTLRSRVRHRSPSVGSHVRTVRPSSAVYRHICCAHSFQCWRCWLAQHSSTSYTQIFRRCFWIIALDERGRCHRGYVPCFSARSGHECFRCCSFPRPYSG